MENRELLAYRENLIKRIQSAAQEFSDACSRVKDPFAPVEADGWNTHQLAAHTRDVQIRVYGARVRRTAEEDRPVIPNFDGEAWNREHYHEDEPIAAICDEFQADVRKLVPWLVELPPSAWSRLSWHEVYGEFTLQTWVERLLAHIEEHLLTIKKIG